MSKVYGIHVLELNPGVTPEEFESFMMSEGAPLMQEAAAKTYLMKGDRGARTGKYCVLIEFPSEEARNKAYPVADVSAQHAEQEMPAEMQRLFEKFVALVSGLGDPATYTDYVVLTASPEAAPEERMAAVQNA